MAKRPESRNVFIHQIHHDPNDESALNEDELDELLQSLLENDAEDESDLDSIELTPNDDEVLRTVSQKTIVYTDLPADLTKRFRERFTAITSRLLSAAEALEFKDLREKETAFAPSGWATLKRHSCKSIDDSILSALDNATKACFGKPSVQLQDLEGLSLLDSKSDRAVRGVYMCIAYGPDGEFAIYIGSTKDLVKRLRVHERKIENKDQSAIFYRTVSQKGWRHT
jgi:hypothetical protein